ncbi:isoflavone reductase family protein [Xylogone sp. PMI_703]|nr:isoflavone reductase family protein [Xylogone sp. PMI_703]
MSSNIPQPKSILVIGATGLIGEYILDALIQTQSHFDKIGIFTSPGTVEKKPTQIQSLKDQSIEVIVGDVNIEQDVKKAYQGYDTVISAVGRNVIASQIELIRWAEETPSINYFYPSEYGTDIEYGPQSATEKPHQFKLKVRAYIKSSVKRLKYTYVVTGPYADLYIGKIDNEKAKRTGNFDVKAREAILLGTGDEKVSLTTMADVGKFVVGALRHPEQSANKALKVNSFTTTPKEILREFEKQTGSTWKVSFTPLDELKKLEQEAWASGDPAATVYTLRRIWTEGGTLYDKIDNEAIGVTVTDTLESTVKKAIEKQQS